MTKRDHHAPDSFAKLGETMKKHLRELGFKKLSSYETWCEKNGFGKGTEKNWEQLETELAAIRQSWKTRHERSRIYQNPAKFLHEAAMGTFPEDRIQQGPYHQVLMAIGQAAPKAWEKESLADMLVWLNKTSKFVFEARPLGHQEIPYIYALLQVFKIRCLWKRPYQTWVPKTHNLHHQFESFLNHVLCIYPVPGFMHGVWFRTDPRAAIFKTWFLSLGKGCSLRSMVTPVPFTKKSAHLFLKAPSFMSIEQALIWSRALALGGDLRLAESILASKAGETLDHWDFWDTVWQFFINHPTLDRVHVGPIIDFLMAQKFETQERLTGPGILSVVPPPDPRFTMKGRTPQALLKRVNAWHEELAKSQLIGNLFFHKSAIPPFSQKQGKQKQQWVQIRQLLSGQELIDEGKRMHHCVASYAKGCAMGNWSIWSLTLKGEKEEPKHLLTIEVRQGGEIFQARGKWNRLPTVGEFSILEKWAKAAGLKISPFVRAA